MNKIFDTDIDEVFSERYALYGSATVKSRAIPSVYDGLNPVSRKILTTFHDEGYSLKFSKAAMYVGTTLARYAPVGDASVYESMVGLSQPFNKLNPFIDKQGNVGSVDDFKSYAAQRYVELRMSKFTNDIFFDEDYNSDYIPMMDNYDGTRLEPKHLPAKFPMILNSGMLGIGSGFASEIPPHKVDDICNITIKYIDNPSIKDEVLVKDFRPDFPMGGIITNSSNLVKMYKEGKGSIQLEALIEEGTYNKQEVLVVKELPYKISTSKILNEIQAIVTSKNPNDQEKLNMLADVKDLSSKTQPVELVLIPKRGTSLAVLRNSLLQYTSLRTSVKYLPNVLVGNDLVENATIKQILEGWLRFRINILNRKFAYQIKKYSEQVLLKEALIKAHGCIDELVETIKASTSKEDSIGRTMKLLKISRRQAEYIVTIQLYQINKLEVKKLKEDIQSLEDKIDDLIGLVSDEEAMKTFIKDELAKIAKKYKADRRTSLQDTFSKNLDVRDIIESQDLAIAISNDNYIYTKNVDDIKGTKRGAKGSNFIPSKYNKTLRDFFVVNSHDDLLVFTAEGKVFELKGYELNLWHKSIHNAIKNLGTQTIIRVLKVNPVEDKDKHLLFTTKKSRMKLVEASEIFSSRKFTNGNLALKLMDNDSLLDVTMVEDKDNVHYLVSTNKGKAQHMTSTHIGVMRKASNGYPKFTLDDDEEIVSVNTFNKDELDEAKVLVASTKGLAIVTTLKDFPLRRGDSGMRVGLKLIDLSNNAKTLATLPISGNDEVIASSSSGKTTKIEVGNITPSKRGTKGVKLLTLETNESLTNLALV